MKFKNLIIAFFCLLLIACAAQRNDQFNDGYQMPQTMDASSQYRTGMRYLLGQGVAVDYGKAYSLFKSAAAQGSARAQNELGYMYLSGLGVNQDYQEAFYWFQQAADNGSASAQYYLGKMYFHGLGVPADKLKAEEFYRKAIANGFTLSA